MTELMISLSEAKIQLQEREERAAQIRAKIAETNRLANAHAHAGYAGVI